MDRKQPICLTLDQVDFFSQNGYLTIEDHLTPEQVHLLKEEIERVIDSLDLLSSRTIFTTEDSMKKMSRDVNFLRSGDTICHFWEEKAFDEQGVATR